LLQQAGGKIMADKYSDERRSFLKTLAIISGVAATVPMARKALPAGKQPQLLPEKPTQGYRETEHISKYYQTAKS